MNPLEALLAAAKKKNATVIVEKTPPKINESDVEVRNKNPKPSMKRHKPTIPVVEEKKVSDVDRSITIYNRPRFCRVNKKCRVIADCQGCIMKQFAQRAACVKSNEIPEPIK